MITRTTLVLLSTITSVIGICQPVLEQSDLPTNTLSLPMLMVVDAGTSDPTPNGAAVTWDFSSAQLDVIGTVIIGPADQTPYAVDYPTANWASTNDFFGLGQNFTYYRSNATGFELIANGVPDNVNAYSDPKQLLQFPFSYQNMFSDTYQHVGEEVQNVTWTYAGYGTVITEIGTFQNVVKTVSSQAEIIFWRED
ncbi:MAG: hypothetical protein M3R08_04840, partial [Bacteroidota bacterium]|nr:hypothetical protein [Bacteroidota bacterium]